jgi:hypothetical protein
VFSTLVTFGEVVRTVGVGLARAVDAVEPSTSREVFACSISIRLHSGRQMDVASHAQHPYEAIDRAARRSRQSCTHTLTWSTRLRQAAKNSQ